jgi:hypothetical protein
LNINFLILIKKTFFLVLIGVAAFLVHSYWTKIGVAEIWNTAKWSSMRSSFYHTMRRFSRASSSKLGSERPFSAASAFSEDSDGSALPAPLRNKKKPNIVNNPSERPSNTQSPPNNNNVRRNSSNQVQPVTTIAYKSSLRANYGTKIGQPPENTKIHNVHENNDDASVVIQTHRF